MHCNGSHWNTLSASREREPLITGACWSSWSRSWKKKKSLNSSAEMPPPYTPTGAAAQKAHPQSSRSFSSIRFSVLNRVHILANSKKIPETIFFFTWLLWHFWFFVCLFVSFSPYTFETPHACYSKSSKVSFSPLNSLLRLIEISRYILLSSLP